VQRELDHANDPAGWSSFWYFGYTTAGALLSAGSYTVVITASNSSGISSAHTKMTIGAGSSAQMTLSVGCYRLRPRYSVGI
jgi:hypothetical protein